MLRSVAGIATGREGKGKERRTADRGWPNMGRRSALQAMAGADEQNDQKTTCRRTGVCPAPLMNYIIRLWQLFTSLNKYNDRPARPFQVNRVCSFRSILPFSVSPATAAAPCPGLPGPCLYLRLRIKLSSCQFCAIALYDKRLAKYVQSKAPVIGKGK